MGTRKANSAGKTTMDRGQCLGPPWRAGRVNARYVLLTGALHTPLAGRDDLGNGLADDFRSALSLGGRNVQVGTSPDRLRTGKMNEDSALLQDRRHVFGAS